MVKLKETQRTGKEGELRVIGELLRQGFNVYTPMVDIEGTDCVIKQKNSYLDIQIKTRERARLLLFDVKRFTPRDNFFIICYSLPRLCQTFPFGQSEYTPAFGIRR